MPFFEDFAPAFILTQIRHCRITNFFWITAYAAVAAVNCNGKSTFSAVDVATFINEPSIIPRSAPRCTPDCIISLNYFSM